MHRLIPLLLLIVPLSMLSSGCVSGRVTYDPQTQVIDVRYTRLGDQAIEGFEVIQGSTTIKLQKQASKAEAIDKLLRLLEAMP